MHPKHIESNSTNDGLSNSILSNSYGIFQDVNLMVFVGFGFLYTYLKDHSLSSVALNTILALFTFEFSTLAQGFFYHCFREVSSGEKRFQNIPINLETIIEGDFGAATVLISYGAVMGKANLPQLFFMAFMESIFYSLNYRLGEVYKGLKVTDAGGSMFIHSFGAFFGLGCAWVLYRNKGDKIEDNPLNGASKVSNVFAFIGTIFLWMFWPSFNTALIEGTSRYRGMINTVFSMIGSCVATYITSLVVQKGKFDAEDILNASVSGGVFIGGACNLITKPYASLIVGLLGGIISTLGFEFVGKFVQKKLKLYDTANILSLHGIPGFLGSIVTTICVATMSKKEWGNIQNMNHVIGKIGETDDLRNVGKQAGYQFLVEIITIVISFISGLWSGLIMKTGVFGDNDKYFTDDEYFKEDFEQEETKVINVKIQSNGRERDRDNVSNKITIKSTERMNE
ncbi:MAG: ammonium transporter [archaeon]|nr:ammonium transporter [archaeon]